VEHVAEGQENNRGTPQGCSRGGDGVIKISQSLNLLIAADLRRPSHRPHSARRTRSNRTIEIAADHTGHPRPIEYETVELREGKSS
jgi:hypothetical protein